MPQERGSDCLIPSSPDRRTEIPHPGYEADDEGGMGCKAERHTESRGPRNRENQVWALGAERRQHVPTQALRGRGLEEAVLQHCSACAEPRPLRQQRPELRPRRSLPSALQVARWALKCDIMLGAHTKGTGLPPSSQLQAAELPLIYSLGRDWFSCFPLNGALPLQSRNQRGDGASIPPPLHAPAFQS